MEQDADPQLDRMLDYLMDTRRSASQIGQEVGLHRNTILQVLKKRTCSLKTFRLLEALVEADATHTSRTMAKTG